MKLHDMVLLAALLAGCGGGGESAPVPVTAAPATPVIPTQPAVPVPPEVTPVAPVTPADPVAPVTPATPVPEPVVPAPYAFTPSTIAGSFLTGYPGHIMVKATAVASPGAMVFFKFGSDAATLFNAPVLSFNKDGTINLDIVPSPSFAPGRYQGKATIHACSDEHCAAPLAGSPFQVPYDLLVEPTEGGTQAFDLRALSAIAGAPDWAAFQGNAGHTGFVPVTLAPASFSARWTWTAPSDTGTRLRISKVGTGSGRVYVSTGPFLDFKRTTHQLYALDEADGKPRWTHSFADLIDPIAGPVAVADGKVYMVASSRTTSYLFGFDAANGTQQFRSVLNTTPSTYGAPLVFGNLIYTETGFGSGLAAFDKTSGAQQFSTPLYGNWDWMPAVDGTAAYAFVGATLVVLDRSTGIERAVINDPNHGIGNVDYISGTPMLGVPGSVTTVNTGLVSGVGLVNYDIAASRVRWSAKGEYFFNPAYHNGTIFSVNSKSFALEARAEMDGTLAWSWSPPQADGYFASDVLVTNNLVFISTTTATYAIDRTSHTVAWRYPASGTLALSANGILYIQSVSAIVAINLK